MPIFDLQALDLLFFAYHDDSFSFFLIALLSNSTNIQLKVGTMFFKLLSIHFGIGQDVFMLLFTLTGMGLGTRDFLCGL
ncbi:hypothetical protein ACJX0J_020235, partial [Zea mays]